MKFWRKVALSSLFAAGVIAPLTPGVRRFVECGSLTKFFGSGGARSKSCNSNVVPQSEEAIESLIQNATSSVIKVSPNGRFLAVRKYADFDSELWIHDRLSGNQWLALRSDYMISRASFSPNSKYLSVFTSGPGPQMQVPVLHVLKTVPGLKSIVSLPAEIYVLSARSWWNPDSSGVFYEKKPGVIAFAGLKDSSLRTWADFGKDLADLAVSKTSPNMGVLFADRLEKRDADGSKVLAQGKITNGRTPKRVFTDRFGNYLLTLSGDLSRLDLYSFNGKELRQVSPKVLGRKSRFITDIDPFSKNLVAVGVDRHEYKFLGIFDGSANLKRVGGTLRAWSEIVEWSRSGARVFFSRSDFRTPPRTFEARRFKGKWLARPVADGELPAVVYPVRVEELSYSYDQGEKASMHVYIPTCSTVPKAAVLLSNFEWGVGFLRRRWIFLRSVFNAMGLIVFEPVIPAVDERERSGLEPHHYYQKARQVIQNRFGIPENRVIAAGISSGNNPLYDSIFKAGDTFLGFVDMEGGGTSIYREAAARPKVAWIHASTGEYESSHASRKKVIRSFSERFRGQMKVTFQTSYKDAHVEFLAGNLRNLARTILDSLVEDDLVDAACMSAFAKAAQNRRSR